MVDGSSGCSPREVEFGGASPVLARCQPWSAAVSEPNEASR